MLLSALPSNRTRRILASPASATTCKAVCPAVSLALMSHPARSRHSTMFLWPCLVARWSGVRPTVVGFDGAWGFSRGSLISWVWGRTNVTLCDSFVSAEEQSPLHEPLQCGFDGGGGVLSLKLWISNRRRSTPYWECSQMSADSSF